MKEEKKMGAVNYFTSDYITIGYNLNNIDYEDNFYYELIQDVFDQVNYLLNKCRFYYFNVTIKPGYYEGFTIDIENNFSICFDDYREKLAVQKEITQIKKFLIYCINSFNLVSVWPGWCTTYFSRQETLKSLNKAIKEMREDVKNTLTYNKWKVLEQC